MKEFSGIINWENFLAKSQDFKNQKPFRFAFIEDIFNKDFYEKLYESYPSLDKEDWHVSSMTSKLQLNNYWNDDKMDIVKSGGDPRFSNEWNTFKKYTESQEFIENIRKFSGIDVNRLKHFVFSAYKKGGFQLPHIHNVGPTTLILMLYFSKNWKKGDPGGTYMTPEEDESSMIFEPYNLDNSMAIFHDGPNSGHGVRYITKDVERRAVQIYFENYSSELGWSDTLDQARHKKENLREL